MKWSRVQTWFLLTLKSCVKMKLSYIFHPPGIIQHQRLHFDVGGDRSFQTLWRRRSLDYKDRTWTSTLCLCLSGMGCIIRGADRQNFYTYIYGSSFSTLLITVQMWLCCHLFTSPRSLRPRWRIYHIVRRDFIPPLDKNLCCVLCFQPSCDNCHLMRLALKSSPPKFCFNTGHGW